MTGTIIRPEPTYSSQSDTLIRPEVEPIYHQGKVSAITNGEMAMVSSSNHGVDHIPLAKTRVLYLGSAVPIETANGLEAVQMPLRERYAGGGGGTVEGIDTWLSVFSSGLVMQYTGDKNSVTWWPISALHVCAAVKCVMQGPDPKFVALDSAAGQQSSHPPMFAVIMRRTKGVKVLECHIFVCKSDQAALALVQSCTHAYEHKELWTNDQPPTDLLFKNESHLFPATQFNRDPKVSCEFYQKPPKQGYFYSSRKDLVRNFNLSGDKPKPPAQPQQQPPPPPPLPPPGPPMMPLPPPPPGPMPMPMMMPMPPPPMMPLPMPPPGYFADWDDYGGQPVAVFPPYQGLPEPEYIQTKSRKKKRSPERRRHYSSSDEDSGSEYSEYFYERRPRSPPADYRESPYEYDRHVYKYQDLPPPPRDDYLRGYDRSPPRDRRDYPRRDYDRRDPDDLVLYAPRYKRDFY